MSNPLVSHWTCGIPKAGADEADFEDAAAIATENWPVCVAVADGATESVFARTWAKRLVHGFVDRKATTPEAFRDAVSAWRGEWQARTHGRAEQRPWYVAAKAAEGAYAALLGLSLHAGGQWQAMSIGDCCLFHVRDGVLERGWPFESPDAFTKRPALVPSRSDQPVPLPETASGTWHPQDTFLLATDAVAAWLLGDTQGGADPSSGPTAAMDWNEHVFRSRVEQARAEGTLRNDDATLLVIQMNAAPGADDATSADP